MATTARLAVPGALPHVMIRGIERRPIFRRDKDREDFLDRMGSLLPETGTACYAWEVFWMLVKSLARLVENNRWRPEVFSVIRRLVSWGWG
jgi:hypothetical protein